MDIVQKVTLAIEPSLEAMGYRLVLVKLGDAGRGQNLTVMAERLDDAPMSVEDCVEISRNVGALLEVEDPIPTAYDLEVCSPGLDRPLTRIDDYSRYAGNEAKLETFAPIDGRKRFRGILLGASDDKVRLRLEEGEMEIPFRDIRTAKLLMSEQLLKKAKG